MRLVAFKKLLIGRVHWSTYLFEFVVIFLSIFLTFELDDYREYLSERKKEEIYLLSLYDDFDKDINQLNRRIEKYNENLTRLEQMRSYLSNYNQYQDSIQLVYANCLAYTFLYNPANSTLESLKSSGDIKLIDSENIKILLSELDKQYVTTYNAGHSIVNLTEGNLWISTFVESVDVDNFHVQSHDPIITSKLQNLLTLYIKYTRSYFFVLQGTLEKTKEAKVVLANELKRRKIPSKLEKYNAELIMDDLTTIR